MTGAFGYILAALLAGGGAGYLIRGRRGDILTSKALGHSVTLVSQQLDRTSAEHSGELRELGSRIDALSKSLLKLENKLSFTEGELRGIGDRKLGELRLEISQLTERLREEIVAAGQESTKGLITREEVQAAFAEVARATAAQQAAQQQAAMQRQLQRQQEVFGARQAPPPVATPPVQAPARPRTPLDNQALNAQLEALNQRLAEIAGAPPG